MVGVFEESDSAAMYEKGRLCVQLKRDCRSIIGIWVWLSMLDVGWTGDWHATGGGQAVWKSVQRVEVFVLLVFFFVDCLQ